MDMIWPEWTTMIAPEDVPGIMAEFGRWWEGAREYAPHLEDKAAVVQAVSFRPEHVHYVANLVAAAYRHYLEGDE